MSDELLILASASPRRAELLAQAGIAFRVMPSGIPEKLNGREPARQAVDLALAKAMDVAGKVRKKYPRFKGQILGADTLVWLAGKALEKPRDASDAARMLRALSGKRHEVVTGIALLDLAGKQVTAAETTRVYFRKLSDREIADYVRGGEPLDKAGAYAIQGGAAGFVRRLEGDYSNVVGLPLAKTILLITTFTHHSSLD